MSNLLFVVDILKLINILMQISDNSLKTKIKQVTCVGEKKAYGPALFEVKYLSFKLSYKDGLFCFIYISRPHPLIQQLESKKHLCLDLS